MILVRKLALLFYILLLSSTIFSQPVITSFSPSSGTAGSTVIITGTNFDPVAANNIVYFGPVKAAVTAATSTTLTVIVPVFAGNTPITVTTNQLTGYSITPFAPAFTGGAFNSKIDFRAGREAIRVVTGDLDGDGKPDIVCVNNVETFMSIFRNTSSPGAISLDSRIDLPVSGSEFSVALADFDGDGKLDIICISNSGQTSSIFKNTSTPGNISLVRQDFIISLPSDDVAIGDIDGDGKPDLAISISVANEIAVFLNNSSGGVISFKSEVDLFTSGNSFCIHFKDVDGDNKPDLSIVSPGDSSFTVFRNLSVPGSVIFAPRAVFRTNFNGYISTLADFDGDGKLDMAIANPSISSDFKIYRNIGSPGSIDFSPAVNFPVPGSQNIITSGDLDGDGKPDILIDIGDLPSSVYYGKNVSTPGNFSFLQGVNYATGNSPWGVIINDIDGDGLPDIITANRYDSSISILINHAPFALPLSLTSFTAGLKNQQVQLNWQTTREINVDHFDIERSTNGKDFVKAGQLMAVATSGSINSYHFSDPLGGADVYYYRLKMVDKDARFEYSKVVKINISILNADALKLYPNPAAGFVTINHPLVSGNTQLLLVDMQGRTIKQIVLKKGATQSMIDLTGVAKGAYKLVWKEESKQMTSTLIVK